MSRYAYVYNPDDAQEVKAAVLGHAKSSEGALCFKSEVKTLLSLCNNYT